MRKHIVDENLISALKIAIQKLNDQEERLESIFSSGAWRVARLCREITQITPAMSRPQLSRIVKK